MEVFRIFRTKREYQLFFFSFIISLIFSVIYSEISIIRFFEYKLTALDLVFFHVIRERGRAVKARSVS